ncbi:hypothetical protein DERF_006946 [Dermatophagoides farinae]|uniref:Uncharacterized protein n=1 Tax=Dermatophagoides farinae TaxID=6954 RepID=A0A922L353_DERFA|nr:hypothetical protein DERF_006946 [Dermatophagoides farinae]
MKNHNLDRPEQHVFDKTYITDYQIALIYNPRHWSQARTNNFSGTLLSLFYYIHEFALSSKVSIDVDSSYIVGLIRFLFVRSLFLISANFVIDYHLIRPKFDDAFPLSPCEVLFKKIEKLAFTAES